MRKWFKRHGLWYCHYNDTCMRWGSAIMSGMCAQHFVCGDNWEEEDVH